MLFKNQKLKALLNPVQESHEKKTAQHQAQNFQYPIPKNELYNDKKKSCRGARLSSLEFFAIKYTTSIYTSETIKSVKKLKTAN